MKRVQIPVTAALFIGLAIMYIGPMLYLMKRYARFRTPMLTSILNSLAGILSNHDYQWADDQ